MCIVHLQKKKKKTKLCNSLQMNVWGATSKAHVCDGEGDVEAEKMVSLQK